MKFLCGLLNFAFCVSLISPSQYLFAQRGVQSNGDLINSYELLVNAHKNKLPKKWNMPIGFSDLQKNQYETLFRQVNYKEMPRFVIHDSKISFEDRDLNSHFFAKNPISISLVVYPNKERAFLITVNKFEAVWTPSGNIDADYQTLMPFLKKSLINTSAEKQSFFFKFLNNILPTAEASVAGVIGIIAVIAVAAALIYGAVHISRKVGKNIDETGRTARVAINSASQKANENIDKVGDSAKKVSDAAANTLNSATKVLDESAATIAAARENTVSLNSGGVVLTPTTTH